jgi:16S rRNA (cytosine967-C5)-methyltransferase
MSKGIQTRLSIHFILKALKNNTSNYDEILKKEINKNKYSTRDTNLIQAVVLDSLRYNNHIKIMIDKYAKGKVNEDSYLLLLSSITQLIYLDFKDYAVINSTVELSKNTRIKTYPGFINALLKKIINDKERLKTTSININCLPKWFVKEIKNFDKNMLNNFLDTLIEKPNLHIVFKNNSKLQLFIKEQSQDIIITSENSLMLMRSSKIEYLPRYNKGEWWIQDYSAMLPLHLIDGLKNKKIIDLCAAPGGKAFQTLLNNSTKLVEKNLYRAKILKENLDRLKFDTIIEVQDALKIDETNKYDIILIDAPCSAVGTIRKNPEIFFRTTEVDIKKYIKLQKELMNKAVKLTKKNSEIIYMVCSFLEIETSLQSKSFLKFNKNFIIKKFTTSEYKELIDKNGFIQIMPSTINKNIKIDGFFAARLLRND